MAVKLRRKSSGYNESDAHEGVQPERPIHDERIGRFKDRLKEDIGTRGVREYASNAHISEGAIFSYLKGATFPTLDRLDSLAKASGRSIEWFLSIDTTRPAVSQSMRIDAEILGRAVYVLNGLLAHADSHLDPEDYAEMLLVLVEYLREHSGALAPDNVINIMERIRSRRNERR